MAKSDGKSADDDVSGLQVDKELEEACTAWRAFAEWSHQTEMCRAADYSDEVCVTASGNMFRQFYCCRGMGMDTEYECGHMIPAPKWDKLHSDFEAVGQRWYCKACSGTTYKCKCGQVVELRVMKQGGNLSSTTSGQATPRRASMLPSS